MRSVIAGLAVIVAGCATTGAVEGPVEVGRFETFVVEKLPESPEIEKPPVMLYSGNMPPSF
ncbi:MAG TPA: hypothetical protein HA362_03755 [Nanoarchaeota archaeon]|nr:hypothetical protein [Nanoarchaeota archaeon]